MTDEELMFRAVRAARGMSTHRSRSLAIPRWTAVMEVFVCGSTTAKELCRRFNLNPDELVKP